MRTDLKPDDWGDCFSNSERTNSSVTSTPWNCACNVKTRPRKKIESTHLRIRAGIEAIETLQRLCGLICRQRAVASIIIYGAIYVLQTIVTCGAREERSAIDAKSRGVETAEDGKVGFSLVHAVEGLRSVT